jgi:hypothetical protein
MIASFVGRCRGNWNFDRFKRRGEETLYSWESDAGLIARTRMSCLSGRQCSVTAQALIGWPFSRQLGGKPVPNRIWGCRIGTPDWTRPNLPDQLRVFTAPRCYVRNWALADWQLSRPIAAGRLSDRIGGREWFERRYWWLAAVPGPRREGQTVAHHNPLDGIKLTRDAGSYAVEHINCLFPEPERNVAVIPMLDIDRRKTMFFEQSRSIVRAVRPNPDTSANALLRGWPVVTWRRHLTILCGKRTVCNWARVERQLRSQRTRFPPLNCLGTLPKCGRPFR